MSTSVPFGEVQGVAPGGIPAYSNKCDMHFSAERNFDGEIFTGFAWQCVEYSRRWLLEKKGLLLPDVPWAVHIFNMTEMERVSDGEKIPCVAIRNGTSAKPEVDTLLIYPSAEDNVVGHVACITEVGDGWIRIADQNQRFHKWEGDYSAQLTVVEKDGTYTVQDVDTDDASITVTPLGWVTFPGVSNRDPSVPLTFAEKYKRPTYPTPILERVNFIPTETKSDWLDVSRPCIKKFVDTFGMDLSRTRLDEAEANYYRINVETWFACQVAGNQLHKIFLDETAKVVASDDLLKLFGIPERFWQRVRNSFANQKKCISGRFDFALSEDGEQLKCFEYNADSASTLLECAVIQEQYAQSIGVAEDTRSSGFRLQDLLDYAWRKTGLKGKVHFCVDNDDEEQYTGLFVKERAESVGLTGKLCVMFDEFSFDDEGHVVDTDGDRVQAVWKTWAWETAFADFTAAEEERGAGWKAKKGVDKVRLCDLVLGDESIVVFEPLWKVIPSNKAILPMIYEANPTHKNILPASFTVTDELRTTGYATKPIVGRTGSNITITGKDGSELDSSKGKFGDRDTVYQQLFSLPKRDGYHAIFGGWMAGDEYAGTGIREDKSIITNVDSPFSAIRVVLDWKPKPVTAESLDAEKKKKEAEGDGSVASPATVTARHR